MRGLFQKKYCLFFKIYNLELITSSLYIVNTPGVFQLRFILQISVFHTTFWIVSDS